MEKPKTVEHHWGATVIPPRLVIAIDHSILGIFQNFKIEKKLDFVSYIWLVKLEFKEYHLDGQNCISVAIKDKFLNTLHSIDHFGFHEALKFIIILIWNFLYTIRLSHQQCTTSKNEGWKKLKWMKITDDERMKSTRFWSLWRSRVNPLVPRVL